MRIRILLVFAGMMPLFLSHAQNARSIDGKGNNLIYSDWGAAHSEIVTRTSLGFEDGFSEPGGTDRPSPRLISNLLFRQDSILPDVMHLSDYCWVFGQFIDHDITLTENNGAEPLMIPVPQGDQWFDPFNTGQMVIPTSRNQIMPGTGTDINNPRRFPNSITAFLDASAVYGSDLQRANWLRTFAGGKMKTSEGNLLPYNTITGEYDDDIDPNAPGMADDVGFATRLFVAGDVRANENPLLLSFHTLFVREHNRICDELRLLHPNWRDEQLYQGARKRVGALMQAIVYEEWLPTMGVNVPSYNGYDSGINPGIFNVFGAAAFRMGHTLLNGNLIRLDNDGQVLPNGNLELKDAFFNVDAIAEVGGIEPYFKGMGIQIQQSFDAKVIDDVRNFLFGPPGSGGLDLASINIMRGRERGLPDYNTVRENFGLPRVNSFSEINSNIDIANVLDSLYSDVNNIDAWVGMLAEERMNNALFGELVMKIMEEQFRVIRDGDRYYYENDPTLTAAEKEEIKNTRLYHILMRNTNLSVMQTRVFEAMPHEDICNASGPLADLFGNVQREDGALLSDVTITVVNEAQDTFTTNSSAGAYAVADQATCENYLVGAEKSGIAVAGVSTLDLVLISKHILHVRDLDSPYKVLAADVNNSNSVTTLDLVGIRKLVLRVAGSLPNNQVWGFVPADLEFPDPINPFNVYASTASVSKFTGADSYDFIAFKYGDVNNDAPTSANNIINRDFASLDLTAENRNLKAGEVIEIPVYGNIEDIEGIQFTLHSSSAVEILDIQSSILNNLSSENYASISTQGITTFSWNGSMSSVADAPILTIRLKSKKDLALNEALQLSGQVTEALAFDNEQNTFEVKLNISGENANSFVMLQNQPNPFQGATMIGFKMPKQGEAILLVHDLNGKLIYQQNMQAESGNNFFNLPVGAIKDNGIYTYMIQTPYGSGVSKMVKF
ncbi:MAG: peroxidase family protein [Saprospiraceae bacterium]